MAWLGIRYAGPLVFFVWIVLAAAATAPPARGVEDAESPVYPLWPLDLPTRYLTSNFMEYRSGRFHAGLDLKTQSRSGFAARSAEDGSVVRVRATAGAYGKAVYVLGESGRTYVYAHLSRFNDELRSVVRSAQYQSGRYRTGLYFKPGEIEVRRGEVLGLTGESGTGGPHLHFEVRAADNGPVNPQAMGFSVSDTLPPVIYAVRAVPADRRSLIDGERGARIMSSGKGLSGAQPVLQIAGPVAFAAKIVDRSDIRGHKLEPWLIEVQLDGEMVYSCRNDRFEFSENSLQRLEWLELPGGRDHWLFRRPGNNLSGRQGGLWHLGPVGNGLAPGPHSLRIRAVDFAGNESAVEVELLAADVDFPQPPSGGAWTSDPVTVTVDSLSDNVLQPLIEVDSEFPGLRLLDPVSGDPVLAPTALAIVPTDLDSGQMAAARSQGLELMGSSARYMAADWPIDAAVTVELPGAPLDSVVLVQDPPVMVFVWSRGKWNPAGSLQDPEPGASAPRFALSNPGLYTVGRDLAAPVIFPADTVISVGLDPDGEAHGVTMPRWEIFPVDVLDPGSGIDSGTMAATLDGQQFIVEPDLPRDRVLVELPDALEPGRHILVLEVADGAGNVSSAEILLDCLE